MKKNKQSGFSLIELLLVVTILGIISAIGVPSFQKGIRAADNGAIVASMRTMASSQISYYSQNARFATLPELQAIEAHLGTITGDKLKRGKFQLEMIPPSPTPAELKIGYTIVATELSSGTATPYQFQMDQRGDIIQVTP